MILPGCLVVVREAGGYDVACDDERIFGGLDWEAQISGSQEYYRWKTNEGTVQGTLAGPDPAFEPDVTPYQEPSVPDVDDLERGDPYPGPRRGRTFSVDSQGRPVKDTSEGGQRITTPEVQAIADYVFDLWGGGGRVIVNDADHVLTVVDEKPVFLGVLEADELEMEPLDPDEPPDTFEDFVG